MAYKTEPSQNNNCVQCESAPEQLYAPGDSHIDNHAAHAMVAQQDSGDKDKAAAHGRPSGGYGAGGKPCRRQLASEGMRAAVAALASRMTSSWTRRGHSLLEISCADGFYLEMFWQAGFDVTGQEQFADLLEQAKERMQNTADFLHINPERLPYDDRSFDYVVCLGGLSSFDDPGAVVREMFRVATRGVLLSFPSAWSLFALSSCFSERGRKRKFFSPLKISSFLKSATESSQGKSVWAGTLVGPAWSWKVKSLQGLNCSVLPLPVGAVSIVRVDFNPPLGMTPLLIGGKSSFKQETVPSGFGQVNKAKQ